MAAGQFLLALITRTCDPVERSVSACEQISSSMSATSISVVDNHCRVLEPIREVSIHDEELATRRLSMMRIMARWMKAATVLA